MMVTDRTINVSFDIRLTWKKGTVAHAENFHVRRGNLWRDIWTAGVDAFIAHADPGANTVIDLPPGRPVPSYDDGNVLAVRLRDIRRRNAGGGADLMLGRFYPRGLLPPRAGVFAGDMRPFRVTGFDGQWLIADLNHPLSPYRLSAEMTLRGRRDKEAEIGGSCIDWLEEAAGNGPGMQVRWREKDTDFFYPGAFRRDDESPDGKFYREKRLVGHVDGLAGRHISGFYKRMIAPSSKVLDLMSGWQSHLPGGRGIVVSGLGMNRAEMAANDALSDFVVHDLNADPALPFDSDRFDVVVCSLSFEYLKHPREVLAETARVLRPRGFLLVGLSERWFPTKAVHLWRDLHPFERLGFVAHEIRAAGGLVVERTESFRNWPRPQDDPHYPEERLSDPVYLLAARRLQEAAS